ncbi:MAG: aminotransferase class V-fold PLP-dependent enzyme [bacterium]|nr:aminotransferase class V-fold PLP-dependent enzyme [bacterium]
MNRVYLDNAATTWPKSEAAVQASVEFIRNCGAASGRGSYGSAQLADQWLERARHELGDLIGATDPADIALCNSGTHALNAMLHGLLRPGDHVITSAMEHNSVLRPLAQGKQAGRLEFDVVAADRQGRSHPDAARELVKSNTRAIVIGHASNVTGAANDLSAWSDFARQHELLFAVDASQSLGYLPIHVTREKVDALASAGHKGLRALQGTGLLYLAAPLQSEFAAFMYGGTGNASQRIDEHPAWPQSIEVGNLNLPGAVSMAVAARELNQEQPLEEGWLHVFQRLVEGLAQIPEVQMVGAYEFEVRPLRFVPVVSLRVNNWDSHDLATVLDTSFGIEVRAGWHCAALVHDAIGTAAEGGTLRLSTGRSTTAAEVDFALNALREILG